jgi:hypothetical protein
MSSLQGTLTLIFRSFESLWPFPCVILSRSVQCLCVIDVKYLHFACTLYRVYWSTYFLLEHLYFSMLSCMSSHNLQVFLFFFSLLEKEMDRLREELRLEKEKVIPLLHFLAKICLIVLQLLAQKHDS